MGSNSNSDFGFEKRSGNFVNHQPSGSYLVTPSVPTSDVNCNPSPSSNGVDSFGTSWDPFVPMASLLERDLFPYNNLGGLENHVPTDTSHLLECSRVSPLGRGSFPNIVGPLDLSNCRQIAGAVCTLDYRAHNKHEMEKISLNERSGNVDLNEGCKRAGQEETNLEDNLISENGKKRKRIFDAQFDNIQNASTENLNDVSQATKQKEQNVVANSRKPSTKEAKDHSQDGDSPKDDYIHIRARRGQATNSHSLAERVRREKISERMRYLQDLVPGCNKITGKAVMLDEIINYVQSLQRQVEFLSMKLAAVNPELNFDIDRILSKDVLNSRGSGSAIVRFAPGMNPSHPHLLGPQQRNVQEEMVNQRIDNLEDVLKATNSQFSTMAQLSGVWDDELQNIIQQMGLRP